MDNIIRIKDKFAECHKNIIRNKYSSGNEIIKSLNILGGEIGKKITEHSCIDQSHFKTPMNIEMDGVCFIKENALLVSTSVDGGGISEGIKNTLPATTYLAKMEFKGARGRQALIAPVRNIELPVIEESVKFMIVAKSVLATGCTAIRLTKAALVRVMPTKIYIATIFYSMPGIAELAREFPNAYICVVGEPDEINADGMLLPGIGDLDTRITAVS